MSSQPLAPVVSVDKSTQHTTSMTIGVPKLKIQETRSWCHQRSKLTKCVHLWTIENFSYFGREFLTGALFSPNFYGNDEEQASQNMSDGSHFKWRLKIHPWLVSRENPAREFVGLYLEYHPEEMEDDDDDDNPAISTVVKARFTFSILGTDSEWHNIMRFRNAISFSRLTHQDWGTRQFVARDDLFNPQNGLMANDTLTICCEVIALSHIAYESRPSHFIQPDQINLKEGLNNDFSQLLENGEFADLTIVLHEPQELLLEGLQDEDSDYEEQTKEYKLHRAVLATRFPYFERLLEMQENMTRIHLYDIKSEVFEAMIYFVYSGKLPALAQMDEPLLEAAHKFQLDPLKRICELSLITKVNTQTASQLLEIADMNLASKLKTKCISFIRKNPIQVLLTEQWKKLVANENNCRLLRDVFAVKDE